MKNIGLEHQLFFIFKMLYFQLPSFGGEKIMVFTRCISDKKSWMVSNIPYTYIWQHDFQHDFCFWHLPIISNSNMVAQWGWIITDGEFLLHTMYSGFSQKNIDWHCYNSKIAESCFNLLRLIQIIKMQFELK